MTDRPILFSGPMVRALLEGRKSQTRRVLKPQPVAREVRPNGFFSPGYFSFTLCHDGGANETQLAPIPYASGDRLWVREAWRTSPTYDDLKPSDLGGDESIQYAADGAWETWGWGNLGCIQGRSRPSMFMPRWASRLTLTVTDVRVQRLQEISEADAKAEGVEPAPCGGCGEATPDRRCIGCLHPFCTNGFANLWDSLNQKRGFGWSENPWVAAYTFTVHRSNIDQMDDRY